MFLDDFRDRQQKLFADDAQARTRTVLELDGKCVLIPRTWTIIDSVIIIVIIIIYFTAAVETASIWTNGETNSAGSLYVRVQRSDGGTKWRRGQRDGRESSLRRTADQTLKHAWICIKRVLSTCPILAFARFALPQNLDPPPPPPAPSPRTAKSPSPVPSLARWRVYSFFVRKTALCSAGYGACVSGWNGRILRVISSAFHQVHTESKTSIICIFRARFHATRGYFLREWSVIKRF